MRAFALGFIVILYCFVREFSAQDDNIGLLPAGQWTYYCDQDDVKEDVPSYLLICVEDTERNCYANVSAPFLYWLQCEADYKFETNAPTTCEWGNKEKCNITCSGDPARAIYRPLYHPNEKIRIYHDIFAEIHNVSMDYLRGYVKMLRKTFTSQFYSKQYNYMWKDDE